MNNFEDKKNRISSMITEAINPAECSNSKPIHQERVNGFNAGNIIINGNFNYTGPQGEPEPQYITDDQRHQIQQLIYKLADLDVNIESLKQIYNQQLRKAHSTPV